MHTRKISICCVGDLILDQPGPVEPYFEGLSDVLRAQTDGANLGVKLEWSDNGSFIRML